MSGQLYDNTNQIRVRRMSTNNEKIININLDGEEQCERCGGYHCEEDEEHETRDLFGSNKDGKNICRRCIREEDEEEEDEENTTCGVCKAETCLTETVGCCVNERQCGTHDMCAGCGEYDEDTDEWTCNKCA